MGGGGKETAPASFQVLVVSTSSYSLKDIRKQDGGPIADENHWKRALSDKGRCVCIQRHGRAKRLTKEKLAMSMRVVLNRLTRKTVHVGEWIGQLLY